MLREDDVDFFFLHSAWLCQNAWLHQLDQLLLVSELVFVVVWVPCIWWGVMYQASVYISVCLTCSKSGMCLVKSNICMVWCNESVLVRWLRALRAF